MATLLEQKAGDLLRAQGLQLATAESCTGGLVSSRITDIAGSSDYYLGGVVAYANEVKVDLLGVTKQTLIQYGAVSREAILEMAEGAKTRFQADVAISLSGIAGPGGGLPDKPVGTVWIGVAAQEGSWARVYQFKGDREQNKSQSADAALEFLIDYLTKQKDLEKDFRSI